MSGFLDDERRAIVGVADGRFQEYVTHNPFAQPFSKIPFIARFMRLRSGNARFLTNVERESFCRWLKMLIIVVCAVFAYFNGANVRRWNEIRIIACL